MKNLIYLLLILQPAFAFGKVSTSVVEQRYLAVLGKSFNDKNLSAPRSTQYWSLCLGEKTALEKTELEKRITALGSDNVALISFYKRLNFYRAFKGSDDKKETYGQLYLPYENRPRADEKGSLKIPVLSYAGITIEQADWQTYTDYVTSFGQDINLVTKWSSCNTRDTANDKIFVFVEMQPLFPGGDGGMMKFLQYQIQYPVEERDNDIQGKVLTRFVVCPDGHVAQGTIVRSVSPGLDRESMLMLKMLPDFIPGRQAGLTVPVYFNLPIVFRLQ